MWHLSTTVVTSHGGTTTIGYQTEEKMLDAWGRAMDDPYVVYAHFTRDGKIVEQFVRQAASSVNLGKSTARTPI